MTEIKNGSELKSGSVFKDRLFLLILFLGIIFKILFIIFVPDAPEDAFNYVNYADKAIRDGYWGQPFFGREAHFLFTFLLYILALIFRSGFWGGKVLSLAATTITIILTYDIAVKHISRRCGLYAVTILSFTSLGWLTNTLAVLAEPLFMCLCVLTMWLYLEKKPSWLIGIVISVSLWVRLESGFFYPVIFLFYFPTRKWRDMIILTVIGSLAVATRYILLPSGTMGWASKVLSERFGENYGLAEFGAILLKNIKLLVYQLGADSAYLQWIYKIIFGIGFVMSLRSRRTSRDMAFFIILFILVINVLGLSIMKYKRVHPSAERHYVYLAPFFAILIGSSLDRIEIFFKGFLERFGKKKLIRNLRYFRIPVYSGALVLIFFLGAFSSQSSWRLQIQHGFLWRHLHFHDMHKIAGKWIREHIKPGEGVIFSLPTDQFYSKTGKENPIYLWPTNRLDYSYYKENNIRYVLWSDIQSDYYRIRALGRDRDFLFFKYRLAPDNGHHWYGWRSVIYEIDHDFENKSPIAIDYGNGFLARESDGYIMETKSQLNIFSAKSHFVRASFKAEGLTDSRVLRVSKNNLAIGEFNIPQRGEKPYQNITTVTFAFQANAFEKDALNLEILKTDQNGYSSIYIGDLKIEEVVSAKIMGQVCYDEGWYKDEGWGRWISDKAVLKLTAADPGYLRLYTKVKSFKTDRNLEIRLNGIAVKKYEVSTRWVEVDLALELTGGENVLEFIASPGAEATKYFGETSRDLTLAFYKFMLF